MLLQSSPNAWSCLAASFATVLELPFSELIYRIGHDGSWIPPEWCHLTDPLCRRAFHIQEMIRVAGDFGFAVTPIEPRPMLSAGPETVEVPIVNNKFSLTAQVGVLTGALKDGRRHAVVWNLTTILDPSYLIYWPDQMDIDCFWRVDRIESRP